MTKPRITVYIPSHNYGRYLGNAIDSVLRQTVDDWELIVIDDGSTDETPKVMNLYRNHPQISLHTTDGIGLPAVCNKALELSRGRQIIRLDADDVFDENILLVLGNYLDRNPEVALVFPDYFLVDDFGEIFAHESRRKIYEKNHMLDLPPNGACTMIRTSTLRDLGGYREDLGAQDGFDLWTRIRDRYKVANVNLPLFYYRRHGANLTANTKRILSARQQIKKDAVKEQLERTRPVIVVIPCRRNYDFVPDLWNQSVGGASLLHKGIEMVLASELIDHVVVTCDNPDAKDIVHGFNDPRLSFVSRDPRSTILTTSIVPTLEQIASSLDPDLKGITVLRYIQTPFVSTDTLEEAITSLVLNEADSSCGIEHIHSQLFRRTPHGLEILNRRSEIYSDFDNIYRDTNTFTASRSKNFSRGSLHGNTVVYFEVSAAECFFINSEDELQTADHRANNVHGS